MYSQEEILKALQTIQDTCEQYEDCETCPLSKNDFCVLQDHPPHEWRIKKDQQVWRAFKD